MVGTEVAEARARAAVMESDRSRRELAEAVETWLGDPEVDANAVSFARGLEYDERDELPAAGIDRVRGFGLHRWFIPERLGGALRRAADVLVLVRALARRDMNVMVSESTQLWSMLVWIGGDAAQQAEFAAEMLHGDAMVIPCLAYSESAHGADLAANDCVAAADAGHYVLSGEKFPINRGRTSTHAILLAATGGQDDPDKRRQSLLLVSRADITQGKVWGLPRASTYGLRGCDISGIAFDGARVPAAARIGAEGEGLELALRGLLITRTFCTGLSLGTGDTMLRTVAGFLSRRDLYGGPASAIPYVSEVLANAYLSLLVAECESLVAMRGLHLYTEELSLWANLAKVQVARLVDVSATALARTLGARYFMRAREHAGIFQKMLRDGAVVSLFDGSEPVCLDSIAVQLGAAAKSQAGTRDDDWCQLYDLRRPLPAFEPERVTVFGRGRDAVFASLPALVRMLDETAPSDGCERPRLDALRVRAAQLQQAVGVLFNEVGQARRSAARPATGKATLPRLIRLAEEACALHAKVTALGVWLHNRDHLGRFFADGAWLLAALNRAQVHRYATGDLDHDIASHLVTRMYEQLAGYESFSIETTRLARPGSHQASAPFLQKGHPLRGHEIYDNR